MTPKEKAEELVDKYVEVIYPIINTTKVKQCALIAADEIIKSMSRYDDLIEEDLKREFGIEFFSSELQNMDGDFRYWQQVKNEIQNL
jgi:hypothetical protein